MANGHGGVRAGQGRPPKATELELIERLSPMDDSALNALKIGVVAGDFNFVKLFLAYRFGQPKQEMSHSGEIGLIWNEIKTYDDPDKEANSST